MQTQGVPDIATSCARPRLARGILQRDEEIHRDEINVAYILGLLLGLKNLKPEEAKKRQKEILDMVTTDVQLRSKRELIKTFIEENLPKLKPNENVSSAFEEFWSAHQKAAFDKLCDEEKINPAALAKLQDTYTFANRLPREQEVGGALTLGFGVQRNGKRS